MGGAALDEIARIVGPANLLREADDLTRYAQDGRGALTPSLAVARPSTPQELSDLVRSARAAGIAVAPQGARTGLTGAAGAASADDPTLIISSERLRGTVEIDRANRTARAPAGTLLSTLNDAAAPHGLHFPIDLGADPSIGGMIAANTGGARFLRYGDVRRNVLEIEAVLADGSIVRFGKGLWKDNSELDLKQLVIGASGTTAIVTAATLALVPLPRYRTTALLALSGPDAALSLLLACEDSFGPMLTAFEGMSAAAMQAAIDHVPGLNQPFASGMPDYAVLIELSGNAVADEDQLETALAECLEPFLEWKVLDAVIDRQDRLWSLRHACPEGLRASGQVIACDVALRRGDLMPFRAVAAAMIADRWPQLDLKDFGHIGDGGLHFNMVWPKAAGAIPTELAKAVQTAIFDLAVNEFGGSFSAEHGVGPRNIDHYARLVSPEIRRLSRAVQRSFAPDLMGSVDFGHGLPENAEPQGEQTCR